VRALIDSSCSFSHICDRDLQMDLCCCSLSKGTMQRSFFHILTYIRPGSLSILSLCCCFFACGRNLSLLSRKQNMNSVSFRSPLFPVVSVLFFVLNRLAVLLTGRETNQTHTRRVVCDFAFSVNPDGPPSLLTSRCSLLHHSKQLSIYASKCRVLLFFSLSLSCVLHLLSLSLLHTSLRIRPTRVSRCCNPAAAPRSK
jgi:hypothetical protein